MPDPVKGCFDVKGYHFYLIPVIDAGQPVVAQECEEISSRMVRPETELGYLDQLAKRYFFSCLFTRNSISLLMLLNRLIGL